MKPLKVQFEVDEWVDLLALLSIDCAESLLPEMGLTVSPSACAQTRLLAREFLEALDGTIGGSEGGGAASSRPMSAFFGEDLRRKIRPTEGETIRTWSEEFGLIPARPAPLEWHWSIRLARLVHDASERRMITGIDPQRLDAIAEHCERQLLRPALAAKPVWEGVALRVVKDGSDWDRRIFRLWPDELGPRPRMGPLTLGREIGMRYQTRRWWHDIHREFGPAACDAIEKWFVATGERAGIPSWARVPLPPSALIEGRVHTV